MFGAKIIEVRGSNRRTVESNLRLGLFPRGCNLIISFSVCPGWAFASGPPLRRHFRRWTRRDHQRAPPFRRHMRNLAGKVAASQLSSRLRIAGRLRIAPHRGEGGRRWGVPLWFRNGSR